MLTHTLLRLPLELITLILQNLVGDTTSLYALSSTCWTVHRVAATLLYRSMGRYNWNTQIGFFKKITDSQSHAILVQAIHVLPLHFQWDPDELRRSLTMALRHTPNLKELRDAGCFQSSLFPMMTPELPVFQLTSFSFYDTSGIKQFDGLFLFLSFHPGLLELSIKSEPNVITFAQMVALKPCHPRIAPRLQFLRGSLATFIVFLAGRNITVLDWEPTSISEDGKACVELDLSTYVEEHLRQIKHLCARQYPYSKHRTPFWRFSQYLHNLEYIDLPGFQVRICISAFTDQFSS